MRDPASIDISWGKMVSADSRDRTFMTELSNGTYDSITSSY
jgi:hypothetical protein